MEITSKSLHLLQEIGFKIHCLTLLIRDNKLINIVSNCKVPEMVFNGAVRS
jgi:hypothetical protein